MSVCVVCGGGWQQVAAESNVDVQAVSCSNREESGRSVTASE
jgi:hypothetical protein